jgi:hypothetical protein
MAVAVKGEGYTDIPRSEEHSVTFSSNTLDVTLPSVGFEERLELNPLYLEKNGERAAALAEACAVKSTTAGPFSLAVVPFAAWRLLWLILGLSGAAFLAIVIFAVMLS